MTETVLLTAVFRSLSTESNSRPPEKGTICNSYLVYYECTEDLLLPEKEIKCNKIGYVINFDDLTDIKFGEVSKNLSSMGFRLIEVIHFSKSGTYTVFFEKTTP